MDHGFPRPFYLIETLTGEVQEAEREAYGKVIRMIAHEVNNTVAGIVSTLDVICKDPDGKSDADDSQEALQVCIERCFNMSRFITNFAEVVRIPEPRLVPSDLNEVVQASMRFMEAMSAHRGIRLHFNPDAGMMPVMLDAMLFEQVLLNIIKNSVESIGENGDIYIRTDKDEQSLEIADNGQGIGKEIEQQLFRPFFSSKPSGQGVGLLFVREVLTSHNCRFSLRTYPDGLTRFIIRFEASHQEKFSSG